MTSTVARTLAAIGVLLALSLAGCRSEPPPPAEVGPSVSGTTVRFPGRPEGIRTEVVQDAGDTTLKLPGRLAWNEDLTVRVFSPFSGRLVRPLVQVGDVVASGQPLAELVSAEYGEALADARRADTDGRLARESLARIRDLHGAGLTPTKELLEAQAMANRAAIDRQRAQTKLAQVGAVAGAGGTTGSTGAAGASAAAGASNFVLRAPIAGVVVERAVNPGQEVRSDQGGAPMFVITDPTHLWAWLDAAESMLPRLAAATPGMAIRIRSDAWGNRVFDATLARKEDTIASSSRTFRLRADVDNPARDLKAEMFVTASLSLPDDAGGKPIEDLPVSAVLLVDGRHAVFVQDSDHDFTRVNVDIVRELPGRVGVIGLPPGQRVVIEGNLFLEQIVSRASRRTPAPTTGTVQPANADAKANADANANAGANARANASANANANAKANDGGRASPGN